MMALAALKALNWKLIGISALIMFILGLMLALQIERRQNDKLKGQVKELTATLRSISDKKNEQRGITEVTVPKAAANRGANSKAEKIEAAPTRTDCKTPPEITTSVDL